MIRPACRPALGGQRRHAVQAGDVIVEQKTMHGVQHVGRAGQLGYWRSQQASLGIVRVDDVVTAAAHLGEQSDGAAGVGNRRDLTLEGQVVQVETESRQSRLVFDAISGARVGCPAAGNVDLAAAGGETSQPAAQQQPGDAVRGDDVQDAGHARTPS